MPGDGQMIALACRLRREVEGEAVDGLAFEVSVGVQVFAVGLAFGIFVDVNDVRCCGFGSNQRPSLTQSTGNDHEHDYTGSNATQEDNPTKTAEILVDSLYIIVCNLD